MEELANEYGEVFFRFMDDVSYNMNQEPEEVKKSYKAATDNLYNRCMEVRDIVKEYNITKVRWYTEGGSTFQESTMNGIFNLKDKVADDDIVLIQFAVSPMITDEIIDDSINVCEKYGNAVAADEMIMCTCIKDDEYGSSQSILRETLVGLKAPWTFKYDLVCRAYEEAIEKNILGSLEPHTTSLMFALGKKIYFSKSATSNIKITRKENLDLFEGYLLLQKSRNLL
jgi:2-C-methyl-D-erythritol 4-phosphate cytidylyltransferase